MESLKQERKGATFDVEHLSLWIFGKEKLEKKRKFAAMIEKDPVFKNDRIFLSLEEKYTRAMEKFVRYMELCKKHNLSEEDALIFKNELNVVFPTDVNFSMFIPTLEMSVIFL